MNWVAGTNVEKDKAQSRNQSHRRSTRRLCQNEISQPNDVRNRAKWLYGRYKLNIVNTMSHDSDFKKDSSIFQGFMLHLCSKWRSDPAAIERQGN